MHVASVVLNFNTHSESGPHGGDVCVLRLMTHSKVVVYKSNDNLKVVHCDHVTFSDLVY